LKRPTAIWNYNLTTFSDLTDNVYTNTAFTFISVSTNYIYVGLDSRFEGLYVDLSTNGSYSGLSYEYITNGETWKKLSLIDNFSFDILDGFCQQIG